LRSIVKDIIPLELIEKKIYLVHGQKVMLDRDLAELYGVETRALNQAVRRNSDRFPDDFMLALDRDEIARISQIVISSVGRKDTLKFSKNVLVFTEQGVAMLSSVLSGKRAVQVNIAIMRTFVKLREMMATHKDLARKLEELEKKYDGQFQFVFDAIRQLITTEDAPKRKIGYIRERRAIYRTSGKTGMTRK
jgi:hypothetical protein